ncbi:MAG TPA: MFS transporter [Acidimicrobiia bacterium]
MTDNRLGRRFSLLWSASGVSNLGDGILFTALPLLVVTLTSDPFQVALASFAATLPWFLFALLSGALADRLDRRRVMVSVDLVRAGLVAVLALTVAMGSVGLLVIYTVAFLLGAAETLFDTSSEAIIPALVPEGRLPDANGRLQGTVWVMSAFVGPPLGALLFATIASLPFALDAASFVIAASLVAMVPGTYRAERLGPPRSLRQDVGEAMRWLYRKKVLFTLALMAGTINLFGSAIFAVFVLFMTEEIGLSEVGYGLLLALVGLAGLVGALNSAKVIRRIGPGATIQTIVGVSAVLSLGMGLARSVVAVAIIAAGYGLFSTSWNVVSVTLRQELTPDQLRGRVASVARLLAWGTQPLGALLGGIVARAFGLRAPFFLAFGAWLLLLALTSRVVNNRTIASARASSA